MTQWEYCILNAYETANQSNITVVKAGEHYPLTNSNRLAALTQLGTEGWELVAVRQLAEGLLEFYLKRPR